jgi:hypothetical protein
MEAFRGPTIRGPLAVIVMCERMAPAGAAGARLIGSRDDTVERLVTLAGHVRFYGHG